MKQKGSCLNGQELFLLRFVKTYTALRENKVSML